MCLHVYRCGTQSTPCVSSIRVHWANVFMSPPGVMRLCILHKVSHFSSWNPISTRLHCGLPYKHILFVSHIRKIKLVPVDGKKCFVDGSAHKKLPWIQSQSRVSSVYHVTAVDTVCEARVWRQKSASNNRASLPGKHHSLDSHTRDWGNLTTGAEQDHWVQRSHLAPWPLL